MSRSLLLLSVALAGYAVLSSVASLLVLAVWRAGGLARVDELPATRARRLVALRALPPAMAALGLAAVVLPAFLLFEPVRALEPAGPALVGLALFGATLLASGLATAARGAFATWRIERQWLRAARPLALDPPAGLPAYEVDGFTPVVALVGVFAPKLIAARAVIDACDRAELASIVAHERGHWQARDNLKRWLMTGAPDVLRWTPAHEAITKAWDDAAEDAADDAATAALPSARLDLAALLVKVARLSASPASTPATVSPFVERDRLGRRVRRLLSSPRGSESSGSAVVPRLAVAGLAALILAVLDSPGALNAVHEAVEVVVAFGR